MTERITDEQLDVLVDLLNTGGNSFAATAITRLRARLRELEGERKTLREMLRGLLADMYDAAKLLEVDHD
ncbi:MAG: hypothetical protein V3W44_07320 [Dehalococcoidales bacterium]